MKLTLQIQLLPECDHAAKLKATVERFNEAANWLAGEAFARKLSNKIELQRLFYADLRERFGLSAQMAVRCIAQVCEAYKRDKTKRPKFRPHAAMPFDQRMMSFQGADRVSLLTLGGRVLVAFVMGKYQAEKFTNAKGQADLVLRDDDKWFLLVTVAVPNGTETPTTDFIGVDLGIENIATDSDGTIHSSKPVETRRAHYAARRHGLGKATKGASRKKRRRCHQALVRMKSKEARYRRDVNHRISKELVARAKDTRRGIAMEDLKGIRDRIEPRFRRQQRVRVISWSFLQLRQFVAYKATLAGVLVAVVDPRNTSRTCAECGHCEEANRKSRSNFECRACGHRSHADLNAARNIALRARASVNTPQGSERQPETAA